MASKYYYYAYIEDGKCVDVERTRTQKSTEDMECYVEITIEEYEASYNDETDSEFYIIGLSWNGENWYLDTMNYYAVIDEKLICRSFETSENEISDASYIAITKGEYDNLTYLNQMYDRFEETFTAVPFSIYSEADTTTISVHGTDVTLQQALDALQLAVDSSDVNITADDVISLLKTKDGEGSELDSDTLDGHDSSEFLTVAAYNVASANVESTAEERHNAIVDLLNGIATTVASLSGIESTLATVKTNTTNVPNIKQTVDTVNTTLSSVNKSVNTIYDRTSAIASIQSTVNAINKKIEDALLSSDSPASSVIKNIQYGYFEAKKGDTAYKTINFATPINPKKSMVLVNGCGRLCCGSENEVSTYHEYAIIELTSNSMKVKTADSYYSSDDYGVVSWQVVEFI